MATPNGLWDKTSEGLSKRKVSPLSTALYRPLASEPRITAAPSPNLGCSGACPDLTNLANRKPTVLEREAQREKFEHWARTTLCGNEFIARAIYSRWNLDGYRIGRALWREMGESELAEDLQASLRAIFALLALGSRRVAQRFFSKVELDKDSPGVYVADVVPAKKFKHLLAGSSCGARSVNDKPAGTTGKPPKPGTPSPLRNQNPPEPTVLFTEAATGKLDKAIGQALKKRGLDGHWLSEEERSIVNGVIDLVPGAQRQAWEWAQHARLHDTFQFFVFRDASATVCLDNHESSTAPADASRVDAQTGKSLLQVANQPGRDAEGGNDSIMRTRNDVQLENGIWTATAVRVGKNGKDVPPEVPMVLGRDEHLLLHAEVGRGSSRLYRAPWL